MDHVRTKRYQLPTATFIRIGLGHVMRQYWWAWLVPAVILLVGVLVGGATLWWLFGTAVLLSLLYVLFWYIQFYGITQLPQGKFLFDYYVFHFDNQRVLLMKNEREGAPLQWSQIQWAQSTPDALLLWLSPVQFFYLPERIFKSKTQMRWLETLLRRKKLLAGESEGPMAPGPRRDFHRLRTRLVKRPRPSVS